MKKNGFTLVELLSIIGILAVILTISIPIIGNYIKDKKKDAFYASAKNILRQIELENIEEDEINVGLDTLNLVDLSDNNYDKVESYVYTKDGKIFLSLKGKGKFDGLMCSGTSSSLVCGGLITLTNPTNIKEYIEKLYNSELSREVNGLKKDNTPDSNIRYYGSNPNNYVRFNNELWRIIGVFGNNVKLVRKDSLGSLSWDSSESSVNDGLGINQWGESTYEDGTPYEGADLMLYLNKMYYGGETVTCYGGENNNTTTCPTGSLNDESKSMIENYTWNTGAVNFYNQTTTLAFYNAERSNTNGKTCTGGGFCNDTVNRTTEWTGYVALPYASDWAYASGETICETNLSAKDDSNKPICKNNNWMQMDSGRNWLLSSASVVLVSGYVCFRSAGAGFNMASDSYGVVPAIYLKSNVLIESGNGSESNPYTLSIK